MFWRYLEKGNPAAAGGTAHEHADAIEKIYRRSDDLVGKVLAPDRQGRLLMVVSDNRLRVLPAAA